MKTLHQLIHSMSKEELRVFKLISNRVSTQKRRKDLLLFDYYKRHPIDANDDVIAKRLYGQNKNAFYQLKNRVFNDVVNSLTFQKLNSNNEMIVSKLILIGKSLKEKQLFNLGYTFLKYAEKKPLSLNFTNF